MSGDRYQIREQNSIHYLTFTVVDWIDVFTRIDYKQSIVQSLNYCIQHKGLEVYAWVLMTNHMHLIAKAKPNYKLSEIIRDFKKFTSKEIVDLIQKIPESRREWLLHKFEYHAHLTGRAKNYKLWADDNHAVCLEGSHFFEEKMNYIHQNPVKQMIVTNAEDYIFSSAIDYVGKKGLVNVAVL